MCPVSGCIRPRAVRKPQPLVRASNVLAFSGGHPPERKRGRGTVRCNAMLAFFFLRKVEPVPVRVDGVELQMSPRLVLNFSTAVNASFCELLLKRRYVVDKKLYVSGPRRPVHCEGGEDKVRAIADHPEPAWVQLLWVRTIGVCAAEAELLAVELLRDHRARHAENRKRNLEHLGLPFGPVRLTTRRFSGGAERRPLKARVRLHCLGH